ncbi:outer membrane beta-barrel protein [uncultured Aquimarina sp.]|uniref:outer membrane beta-barrel protein n=1 Tax=uncultured Aquimarina sp. TaxID=575652 RepID=UPI002621BC15|nr:outer membrane beta-barrel protein [uncultured Aquimarina sp.]
MVSFISYEQRNNIKYGIKAGGNIATIAGREIFDENNPRFSFHIVGLLEIQLSEKFSLQPELLYSQQGSRFVQTIEFRSGPNDEPMLFDIDFDFNLNYIQFL